MLLPAVCFYQRLTFFNLLLKTFVRRPDILLKFAAAKNCIHHRVAGLSVFDQQQSTTQLPLSKEAETTPLHFAQCRKQQKKVSSISRNSEFQCSSFKLEILKFDETPILNMKCEQDLKYHIYTLCLFALSRTSFHILQNVETRKSLSHNSSANVGLWVSVYVFACATFPGQEIL